MLATMLPDHVLLFLLAAVVAIAIFVVAMIARDVIRAARGVPRTGPRRWPFFTFLALIAIITIAAKAPWSPQAVESAKARAWILPIVLIGLVTAYLAKTIGWQCLRFYDRDVSLAWKRKNRGDRDGAIAGLREAIAAKGPSAKRLNGLGLFLIEAGEWGEARRVLEEAYALDPELSRGNLAIALLNLDDPAGAEALYRPLIDRTAPEPGPLELANYAQILIRLNRLDEAESYFERAHAFLAPGSKYLYINRDYKNLLQKQVVEGRAKVAELRGIKGKDLNPYA